MHFHLRTECFFVSLFFSLNNVLERTPPYRCAGWLCAVVLVFCGFHHAARTELTIIIIIIRSTCAHCTIILYISRYYYYHYQHRTFTENILPVSAVHHSASVLNALATFPPSCKMQYASYGSIWSVCSFAETVMESCSECNGTSQAHQWTTHCHTKW